MPLRKRHSLLFKTVLVPVVLIVLGAFVLSLASIFENFRFVRATSQILGFVKTVRAFSYEQKTFSPAIGEDLWTDMVRVQQISPSTPRVTPWGGQIRATAVSASEMRIESNLPSQDCRRISLYFAGLGPEELGLSAIQAQSEQDTTWYIVYPPLSASKQVAAAEAACGGGAYSRLGLIFKMK